MSFSATILADSFCEGGTRLTTMEVTFPRFVLPEFNTHRALSRNSASSRAIPVQKQLDRIKEHPFVPTYWGAAQRGMQAHEELPPARQTEARLAWLAARDAAVRQVERMLDLGLHKQLANRLLEPFGWHTVVVTATEWENFFALRINPDAQPEILTIAELMLKAYQASDPRIIGEGQWHLPLVQPDEFDGEFEYTDAARMISAARCARVSYLTHDGRRDHEADTALYRQLVEHGHMSPLEHVARPFTQGEIWMSNQMAAAAHQAGTAKNVGSLVIDQMAAGAAFVGNFKGWIQLRKTIAGEHNFRLQEGS